MLCQRRANSTSPQENRLSDSAGSALVETIGMMALIALVVTALIEISLSLLAVNSLNHAASIAARAGAIGGEQIARKRLDELAPDVGQSRLRIIDSNGTCAFEVRLTKSIHSLWGEREVHGVAHAVCER